MDNRQKAIVKHLIKEESFSTREAIDYVGLHFEGSTVDTLMHLKTAYHLTIYDETERDAALNEALESHCNEHILSEIREDLQSYFNTELWAKDAAMDGPGVWLGSYDGDEYEYMIPSKDSPDNFELFFIYRS